MLLKAIMVGCGYTGKLKSALQRGMVPHYWCYHFPEKKPYVTVEWPNIILRCVCGLQECCMHAFDSVQTQAILTSLQEQGIEDVYIEILKYIYTDSSVTLHLHEERNKIRINRGVRQGDTISSQLFTAIL